MMRPWTPSIAGTIATLILVGCSQPAPDPRSAAIAEVLETYHALHEFDGVALVAEGSRIVYQGGYGVANAEFEVANSPETRFRVASITKLFTAITVLRLAESGALDLDAPIGNSVFGLRRDIADRVTPWQLLEHRSGLDREYLPPGADLTPDYSLRELLAAVNENTEWIAEPGSTVSYSNAGFVILAGLIENVTGMTYAGAVQEHILDPVGMQDTGFEESAKVVIPGLATGYRLRLGTRIRADRVGMSWVRGNGGIYATAYDLWLLDRALRDGSLLSDASIERMFTQGEQSFAIVWQVGAPPDGYPPSIGPLAWARGANPGGFRTQWTRQLDGDRVVILLANLDHSTRHEITASILSVLLGAEAELPPRPLSHRLYETLVRSGVESALADEKSGAHDDEALGHAVNELVELGHHLIRAQRPTEAIDVFALSDRLFPDNPDIVASLAYANLKSGDLVEARELASRVLELRPGDADAQLILDEVAPH